jgi:hypothetical protein
VYEFDIESLKKQNIGQAVKLLQKYNGTTPFAVAYVTQHALGGHAIPLNQGALIALHTVGVVSDDEFQKRVVPGLERVVPKSKGAEVGSLLHQLGVEVGRNPYGQQARKLMLEIDPNCKDRLPKRVIKQPEMDGAATATKQPEPAEASPATGRKPSAAKEAPQPKQGAKDAKEKGKQGPAKRPAAAKKPAPPAKKPTKKGTKKPTTHKLAKRKPR